MKTRLRLLLLTCLLIGTTGTALLAQTRTVGGKVTGVDGEPLPGVSVLLKGSQRGTTTSSEGRYTLPNVPDGAVLTASYIGYAPQDITVGNRTTVDFSLLTSDRSLSEVIVVGYGTQRKIETTGSIASVKAADLVQTPVANVAQGLQSRVAGVQINQNSGAPGGNVSVRIRGTNSINGVSEPLYIVDGIQISNGGGITDISPLSTINPSDIESVEVLKD
ncbi:MAG: TonB-dependent receptor plug domain-containing protein, partial [Bacteroidetes bacterium]|nr:TonB-dependent receptor plug domain-containing protein [Fibrella sp.]